MLLRKEVFRCCSQRLIVLPALCHRQKECCCKSALDPDSAQDNCASSVLLSPRGSVWVTTWLSSHVLLFLLSAYTLKGNPRLTVDTNNWEHVEDDEIRPRFDPPGALQQINRSGWWESSSTRWFRHQMTKCFSDILTQTGPSPSRWVVETTSCCLAGL